MAQMVGEIILNGKEDKAEIWKETMIDVGVMRDTEITVQRQENTMTS